MAENMTERRFAIFTLGCKVNQEESAAIANVFCEHGWQEVPFGEAAEVTVVNTCTVTQVAEKKSRNMLRRAQAANPGTFVVATGCYAQLKPEEAAALGLDLVLGANEKHRLYELSAAGAEKKRLNAYQPEIAVMPARDVRDYREIGNRHSRTSRTRAFVKIEDGCNQFCSYCIVSYVRGPVRSRPLSAVLAEIAGLVRDGYREVVLTGIHVGAYGTDWGEHDAFARLVEQAAAVPGLARLRLGSVEPYEVSDRLLELAAASSVICPHFHVPLQAASSKVLQLMGRMYDLAFYEELLVKIRALLPEAAVTTDIIAGFPGETDVIFADELLAVRRMAFAVAHIFPYSRRPGTPAAMFAGQVPNVEKNRRAEEISHVVAETRREFRERFIGREIEFLPEREQKKDGVSGLCGYTANYLPVFAPELDAAYGEICRVCVTGLTADGELLVTGLE